ncbi:aminotransferase [Raoultella planticola]|uniref:Aminotransferase n=1 Tax=Raoultella planticola TaxID=575 RepID=A0A485C5P5_RAOPL|nr:aminotransferase [Raoultella planticola]
MSEGIHVRFGAKIPEQYAALGSLEFAKKLLQDAKVCVSPGIGFGDYGIPMCALRLSKTAIVSARRFAGSNRCFVPTGCCQQRASQPAKASNNGAKERKVPTKNGSRWLPFFLTLAALKSSGQKYRPNDDHKRYAHNKVFHDSSLRVLGETPK